MIIEKNGLQYKIRKVFKLNGSHLLPTQRQNDCERIGSYVL